MTAFPPLSTNSKCISYLALIRIKHRQIACIRLTCSLFVRQTPIPHAQLQLGATQFKHKEEKGKCKYFCLSFKTKPTRIHIFYTFDSFIKGSRVQLKCLHNQTRPAGCKVIV